MGQGQRDERYGGEVEEAGDSEKVAGVAGLLLWLVVVGVGVVVGGMGLDVMTV